MKNLSALWKWIVGIIGGVIAGLIIWWLTENKSNSPTYVQPPPMQTDTIVTAVCSIEGRVINKDNNEPLANVQVGYLRLTTDNTEYSNRVKARLATTDIDGKFAADCSKIEGENFPLRLTLQHDDWGATTVQTDEYVRKNEEKNHINIYVPHGLYKKLAKHSP